MSPEMEEGNLRSSAQSKHEAKVREECWGSERYCLKIAGYVSGAELHRRIHSAIIAVAPYREVAAKVITARYEISIN